MPSFARELEQTLHNALGEASKRRHEYATLEHLLIALVDDEHASKVMTACGVNRDELRRRSSNISTMSWRAGRRQRHRPDPDQRLPARRPARDPPRPVVGPRRGHRRQRAGRPVLRARKLCRLFPAAAGHEPPRCGDLHQPRRRQGRCPAEPRAPSGAPRRRPRRRAGKKESALKQFTVDLNEKAKAGKVDPLIGRMPEVDRTVQILCRRSKNNPLYVGDPGVGKTAIAEGLARKIIEGDVPEVLKPR
jgi:ATP-dependent Clp protease ATP-binding subunit ClpA